MNLNLRLLVGVVVAPFVLYMSASTYWQFQHITNVLESSTEFDNPLSGGAEATRDGAPPQRDFDLPPDPFEIELPIDLDGEDWLVGPAPEAPRWAPLALGGENARHLRVWGVRLRPEAGRAVVAAQSTADGADSHATELWWCDLAAGDVTHRCTIGALDSPHDLHPDGRRVLLGHGARQMMGRDELILASLDDHGQLEQRRWYPLLGPTANRNVYNIDEASRVVWAKFVGDDHVVTLCGGGRLHVWRVDDLSKVAAVTGVVGYPALTPDGAQVAFVADEHVFLYCPAAGRVVGAHHVGPPPEQPALAFHPRGRGLAIAGGERVLLVDTASGKTHARRVVDFEIDTTSDLEPCFGWAGDRHLYHRGDLYDASTPIAVCNYRGAEWHAPVGGVVWAAAYSHAQRRVLLQPRLTPTPEVERQIAETLAKPDVFALKPGDAVRVEVAELAPERQAEARETLERRVRAMGFSVAHDAEVVFEAGEETEGKKRSASYTYNWSHTRTYTYDERNAWLRARRNGEVLWERSDHVSPPHSIEIRPEMTQLHRDDWGGPDYTLFAEANLPALLRSKGKKGPLLQQYFAD